jgi:hypothetical protein
MELYVIQSKSIFNMEAAIPPELEKHLAKSKTPKWVKSPQRALI